MAITDVYSVRYKLPIQIAKRNWVIAIILLHAENIALHMLNLLISLYMISLELMDLMI